MPDHVVPQLTPILGAALITTAHLAAGLGCSDRWVETRARAAAPAYRWAAWPPPPVRVLEWLPERLSRAAYSLNSGSCL